MRVDSEVGDAVRFGVNPLIVVVALWKFGKSGREIVTVTGDLCKVGVGGAA